MFEKHDVEGYRQVTDGIEQKTLVNGEKTLMAEFRLQKNAILPVHSHPYVKRQVYFPVPAPSLFSSLAINGLPVSS